MTSGGYKIGYLFELGDVQFLICQIWGYDFPEFNEVTTDTLLSTPNGHFVSFQNCHLLQSSVMHLQHDATPYPNNFPEKMRARISQQETSKKFRLVLH